MQGTCDNLFKKIRNRCIEPTVEEKATFISDGNDQYTVAIMDTYPVCNVNYGQLVKIRDSKGKLIGKEKRVIFGKVDWIETVYIERYNLTLRCGISRLVRKTISFSKAKDMLDKHLDVYQAYNNLIRYHSELEGRTPCMAEGMVDHVWTWEEMLKFKISTPIH